MSPLARALTSADRLAAYAATCDPSALRDLSIVLRIAEGCELATARLWCFVQWFLLDHVAGTSEFLDLNSKACLELPRAVRDRPDRFPRGFGDMIATSSGNQSRGMECLSGLLRENVVALYVPLGVAPNSAAPPKAQLVGVLSPIVAMCMQCANDSRIECWEAYAPDHEPLGITEVAVLDMLIRACRALNTKRITVDVVVATLKTIDECRRRGGRNPDPEASDKCWVAVDRAIRAMVDPERFDLDVGIV